MKTREVQIIDDERDVKNEINEDFGLSDDEIDNIFDILGEENKDL